METACYSCNTKGMTVVDFTVSGVDGLHCVKLELIDSSNAGHLNIFHGNSDCVVKG